MPAVGVPEVALEHREGVAAVLQEALVDLVALSPNGKQAHWHVTGRHFVPVHEQLDAVVAGQVEAVVARVRARVDELGRQDAVTQDLVIEVLRGLERHLWMLQAQLA